jgi:putative cell wall-binding protein
MCNQYTGAANESAATIIYRVGVACGISQKVILVTLQKEEGLVTSTGPSSGSYQTAMGYACPDTSGCDTTYYGFFNQVFWAAWQFKRYGNPPGTSNYFNWYAVGQVDQVRYNPNAACGSSGVLIQNAATAALYYYTPYQPDSAALANLYGVGDSCSAYGNRNFWRYYTDWFGSTTAGVAPVGNYEAATVSNGLLTVSGWALDQTSPTTSIQVQISFSNATGQPSTQTVTANLSRPDVGAAYPGAGNLHGFTATAAASGSGQFTACVTALQASGNTAGNTSMGCKTDFYSAPIGGTPAVTRVSGSDRYATAAALAQSAYPTSGVPVVYITTGQNYADAITAAPAAAAQGGPLLLVEQNAIPSATSAELTALAPKKIVVVGGTSAISAAVYSQLQAIQPSITRIAGSDRFQTSELLAKAEFPAATSVYVATGDNFPDALTASAVAGAADEPVILVNGTGGTLEPTTSSYLTTQKVTKATLVGGTAALIPSVQTSLQSLGITVTRLSGSDRYATSAQLNTTAFPSASTVYMATGLDYPDALAGAAVAGAKKAPLYLAGGFCVPREVVSGLVTEATRNVVLLGGTSALTAEAAEFAPC